MNIDISTSSATTKSREIMARMEGWEVGGRGCFGVGDMVLGGGLMVCVYIYMVRLISGDEFHCLY